MNVLRAASNVLLILAAVQLSGCRKAEVQRFNETVQTTVNPGEPAYIFRAKPVSVEPWYRDLQVVLEKKPEDEKDIEPMLAEHKPAVREASMALMEEVRSAVEARRTQKDRWSILSMACGRPKKGSEVVFSTEIGLTKLYARRPVISFNNVPLDLAVAKLSRETGLQESQQRSFNPRVYWSKNNVSAQDALDDILAQHGYEKRMTDTYHRVGLRAMDFKTREAFVSAAAEAILAKGQALNESRPAIIVQPKLKAPETAAPPPLEPAPEK